MNGSLICKFLEGFNYLSVSNCFNNNFYNLNSWILQVTVKVGNTGSFIVFGFLILIFFVLLLPLIIPLVVIVISLTVGVVYLLQIVFWVICLLVLWESFLNNEKSVKLSGLFNDKFLINIFCCLLIVYVLVTTGSPLNFLVIPLILQVLIIPLSLTSNWFLPVSENLSLLLYSLNNSSGVTSIYFLLSFSIVFLVFLLIIYTHLGMAITHDSLNILSILSNPWVQINLLLCLLVTVSLTIPVSSIDLISKEFFFI